MLAKTGQMAKLTQRTNPLESGRSRAWQRSNGSTTCYGIAEMSTVRLCAAMMPCLMIIGCAGPMGVIHGGTVAAAPVTSFDGSYSSTIRITSSAGAAEGTNWCDTPGQPVVAVANGQFNYAVPHPNVPGNATSNFPATMAQDGSFSGQVVDGTISGRVSGTHIEGSIDGQACVYAFAGDRI
jgi:hypothetical protein